MQIGYLEKRLLGARAVAISTKEFFGQVTLDIFDRQTYFRLVWLKLYGGKLERMYCKAQEYLYLRLAMALTKMNVTI